MIIMKGEKLKNKVSCDLFTVKEVDDSKVVMLEDERGYARIWLRTSDLDSFFEKIEWMER